MKKHLRLAFLLMVIVALFIAAPSSVIACRPEPPEYTEVWMIFNANVKGEFVQMDNLDPIPNGPHVMSDGIKLDGASKICYPFEKGRYGWTGVIYQSINGTWVKLATTNGWLTDAEGTYMACAQARSAGTYVLFGSYSR